MVAILAAAEWLCDLDHKQGYIVTRLNTFFYCTPLNTKLSKGNDIRQKCKISTQEHGGLYNEVACKWQPTFIFCYNMLALFTPFQGRRNTTVYDGSTAPLFVLPQISHSSIPPPSPNSPNSPHTHPQSLSLSGLVGICYLCPPKSQLTRSLRTNWGSQHPRSYIHTHNINKRTQCPVMLQYRKTGVKGVRFRVKG